MAGNAAKPGVSVTSKVLSLLRAFDRAHPRLTLTELATRADLPMATTHRLAAELVAGRVLARRSSGEFVIGRLVWDLGLLAPGQAGLREIASPFLHDIYGATLATIHLGVRDGLEVLYVSRLSGHASVPILSTVGSRLPLHPTAVGKVLLAHAPPEVQAEALSQLTRVTPYTITQPGRLERDLVKIREQGYATTAEEMSLGACSIAVPIEAGGRVVASVGIVVPSLKRDKARLLTALQVAARGIGRSLP